ncbi:MAG TPA: Fic family protein [Ohtaekwangia sp.]|uniref:Fic family protein n=1 Tax=Ohtaekwangia sp. TaxID=2066019 RepID=UPI002F943EA9
MLCKENQEIFTDFPPFDKFFNFSLQMTWTPKPLPPPPDIESKSVLKKLTLAHRALAEFKGIASTIPNENILINTLALQEAKDSSAVENIITTDDELFKSELNFEGLQTIAAKEVQNYASALKKGYALVREYGLLTNNHILEIQKTLELNEAGYRKVPGTNLKNASTGEVVYTPPQHYDTILELMANLEQYINDDTLSTDDPLVKMAVLHFQFESIHPFYDGNGRTGRILNILYLVQKDLLQFPILYLSRHIIRNKAAYYNYLQGVRDKNDWESWILFMLEAVERTSVESILLIQNIKTLMMQYKQRIRTDYKFYSQDLLNNLFKHPYTKIEFLQEDLKISRITAANYLNQLAEDKLLVKKKLGTANYYINEQLYQLFVNAQ